MTGKKKTKSTIPLLSKADDTSGAILVRAPNWIGDCIMSLRALHGLRSLFPHSRIDLFCRPQLAELFQLGVPLDGVFSPSMKGGRESLLGSVSLIRRRKVFYGLGLLFTNSFATALEFRLAGIRHCVGYAADGRSVLLRQALRPPPFLHQTERYDHLLRAFTPSAPIPPAALLVIPDNKKRELREKLAGLGLNLDQPPVVIAPGAAYGTAKRWPKERFSKLIDGLASSLPRRKILCLGAASEGGLVEDIVAGLDPRHVWNLAGKLPLDLAVALIGQSACVLANDSGLMHVAWAQDIPLLALFGPNDPRVSGPAGVRSRIIYKGAECSPCKHRHCPIDHRCMTAISVEEVHKTLLELLDQGAR